MQVYEAGKLTVFGFGGEPVSITSICRSAGTASRPSVREHNAGSMSRST